MQTNADARFNPSRFLALSALLALSSTLGCASSPPPRPNYSDDELLAVVDEWAAHFGYYSGAIDLEDTDLSHFVTADCALTAHAPLWDIKPGEEKAIACPEVRKLLAANLDFAHVDRHQMHMTRHPDGEQLALFFVVDISVALIPIQTTSLAFVVSTERGDGGLRIKKVDEWPAETVEQARQTLVDELGWPPTTKMKPFLSFGARS